MCDVASSKGNYINHTANSLRQSIVVFFFFFFTPVPSEMHGSYSMLKNVEIKEKWKEQRMKDRRQEWRKNMDGKQEEREDDLRKPDVNL